MEKNSAKSPTKVGGGGCFTSYYGDSNEAPSSRKGENSAASTDAIGSVIGRGEGATGSKGKCSTRAGAGASRQNGKDDGKTRTSRVSIRCSYVSCSSGSASVPAATATAGDVSICGKAKGKRTSRNNTPVSIAYSRKPNRGERSATTKKEKKLSQRKKVRGIFGVPVTWNAEDCDYDDSEDETYPPPIRSNSLDSDTHHRYVLRHGVALPTSPRIFLRR